MPLLILLLLTGCATPTMDVKNPDTGKTMRMLSVPDDNGGVIFYMTTEQWEELYEVTDDI